MFLILQLLPLFLTHIFLIIFNLKFILYCFTIILCFLYTRIGNVYTSSYLYVLLLFVWVILYYWSFLLWVGEEAVGVAGKRHSWSLVINLLGILYAFQAFLQMTLLLHLIQIQWYLYILRCSMLPHWVRELDRLTIINLVSAFLCIRHKVIVLRLTIYLIFL